MAWWALAVTSAPAADEPAARVAFADVAARSGLAAFEHFPGRSGKRYIVEVMGSGGGLFDFDGDGDLDVYLLDGAPLPGTPSSARFSGNRLFRNDDGRFSDVTEQAGVGHRGFGMGMAVGDIDGDGDPDLLVTNFGPDVLYRNDGDGTFTDITAAAGVGDPRLTTSATFLDYDLDGHLDLYVTGYVDFRFEGFTPCVFHGVETNCGPEAYDGIPDRLYRNDGKGRFSDVSDETGIAAHVGKGLGVVAGDVDRDGDPDLYVANDGTPNFLFLNRLDAGRAAFSEEALVLGAAFGEGAKAEAGMGADMGDYDGDGDLDIVCTNLGAETNSLYRNDGDIGLLESSYATGLGAATLPWVGFGVRFFDVDLDGDLDLFFTNGNVLENAEEVQSAARFAQPDLLFENREGHFVELLDAGLPHRSGRGLATGDVDGDGDEDVLITNVGEAPFLLRNDTTPRGAPLGLRLEGAGRSNRDAYGARVSWTAFGRRHLREVHAGASYCSSSDPRLILATDPGRAAGTDVEIRWPDGSLATYRLSAGSLHHVVQGRGAVAATPFRSNAPQ